MNCKICLVVSLAILLFLNACSKEKIVIPIAPSFPADTTNPVAKTWLALGDSYTIGTSVMPAENYPLQTTQMLAASGVKMLPPKIIAINGWTTGNLIAALNANAPGNNFDMLSLLIGVNNQYQGRSQQEYKTEFTLLLNRAIEYAGGRKNRVFVLSIPDYSVTPFAQNLDVASIAKEIDEFNAINKEVSLQTGVKYIDITPISRQGKSDGSLQASDGLHPSGKQYGLWAALSAPIMKAAL
ncbi:MAG: SGNH/GDSL hydrolase family protein [Sphingobacteriales bacterium]|nr:MAG: SGNH/GDSL hydrolase family protein [Sphingobacteriales bacterium]